MLVCADRRPGQLEPAARIDVCLRHFQFPGNQTGFGGGDERGSCSRGYSGLARLRQAWNVSGGYSFIVLLICWLSPGNHKYMPKSDKRGLARVFAAAAFSAAGLRAA